MDTIVIKVNGKEITAGFGESLETFVQAVTTLNPATSAWKKAVNGVPTGLIAAFSKVTDKTLVVEVGGVKVAETLTGKLAKKFAIASSVADWQTTVYNERKESEPKESRAYNEAMILDALK